MYAVFTDSDYELERRITAARLAAAGFEDNSQQQLHALLAAMELKRSRRPEVTAYLDECQRNRIEKA